MMMKYNSYVDSGVDCIGPIPEHWSCISVKFILREGVKDGPHETPIWFDQGVPFLSIDGIVDGEISFKNCRFIDEEQYLKFSKKIIIEKDDIFIGKAASIGKVARVKVDTIFTIWSPIAVVKVNESYCPAFVEYFFKSDVVQFQIEILSTSNTQKNIAMGDIPRIKILSPPLAEQKGIAAFLDKKTQEISSVIEKKKQLIAFLREERSAIINNAVTKGINPNIKYKDSGIDWIGEMPEHWDVKKLKYVATLKSGENIVSEQILDIGQYPVYGGNGLRGYYSEFTNDGEYVLIGRQGALCGNINYASGKFWASEHAVVCYLMENYNSIWLGELLRSMNLNQYSQASAQPGLAVEKIKNLAIPFPIANEQNEIAQYIISKTNEIATIISKTEKEIEFMQEYKTALISEVVTGKIDVRVEVMDMVQ